MKRYNLKFWRLGKELTQAEMAKKLGVSMGYYRAIENGVYKPSNKLLEALEREIGPEVWAQIKKADFEVK